MQKNKTLIDKTNYLFIVYQVLLASTVIFLLIIYFTKSEKMAYVDSGKILNEYKGSAEAKKIFQNKAKLWQANIDTLTNHVKKAIQGYEKSVATMSPKEQALSKELIQSKQKQLADYQQAIQQNAKEEDGKLTQNLIVQINAFLLKYGKAHNFKMILIANSSGTIAYAREGLDITSQVIEEMNNEYATGNK